MIDPQFLPWCIKYIPKTSEEIIKTDVYFHIRSYLTAPQQGKALLVYGTPGSGKTTTITLLANELNYELLEVNASDNRNKQSITDTVGQACHQRSLFSSRKAVLLDEVDGITGREDRGGIAAIVKIIKTSPIPILLTANEVELDKLKSLKKQCLLVDANKSHKQLLLELGKRILDAEHITYTESDLEHFVHDHNHNDIRGFINDLQASSIKDHFTPEGYEIRNYKEQLASYIHNIFSYTPKESLKHNAFADINVQDIIAQLEEIAINVETAQRVNMCNELSKIDVYRGRIINRNYWRMLVYIFFTINYALSSHDIGSYKIKRPSKFLSLWIKKNSYSFPQHVLTLLQQTTRLSQTKFALHMQGYLSTLIAHSQPFRMALKNELELQTEDIEKLHKVALKNKLY